MVFRPQVKIMEETKYGTEPTFDPNAVYVLDPEEFNYEENQNIQYSETLSQEDATEAAPGNYEVTGNTAFPIRVTQLPFVNYIGLGEKYETTIYVAEDTDSDGTADTLTPVAKQYVSIPAVDQVPSFTIWANLIKPKRFVAFNGIVFNNYRITMPVGQIIKASFDFAGRLADTIFAYDVPGGDLEAYVGKKASTLPLDPTDVAASQDAGIYGDIEICEYDATNDLITMPDGTNVAPSDVPDKGYEIIDVLYEEIPDSTTDSVPTKVIIGKPMFNVKSVELTFGMTTFTNDAHRIGDRLAQEYPMRTLNRRDFRCDITVDFTGTKDSLYKKFIAHMSSDGHVKPNQVDVGTMSLVVKVGSPTDVIKKSPDKKDTNIKSYMFGSDVKNHLEPTGAFNRTVFIMPNVVLERTGQITARVGSMPELRVTARLLNDNGVFSDVSFETDDGKTITVTNEKLVALSYKKL